MSTHPHVWHHHPPGAVRLVSPAEDAALAAPQGGPTPMANIAVRLAYPTPAVRPAAPAARGLFARLLNGLFRAVDEAPFDLAWPPSARGLAADRAGWRAPYAAPPAPAPDLDYDPNHDLDRDVDPRPARRAA